MGRYTYNGLGLRVGKTDSTGTYSYVCDGTTPGSPVLTDSHTLYTPGLSENRGGTSEFYSFDRIGNLWTADGTGKSQYAAVDYSAFGITLAGSAGTPFGYGGANGCQTDPDASLVLMGHRYFDPRTGRFISQDPAGDGDNWYVYADNNPINETDPGGLMPLMSFPEGSSPQGADQPVWASAESAAMVQNSTVWHRYFVDGPPVWSYETPGVSHCFYDTYWAPVFNDTHWSPVFSGAGRAGFAQSSVTTPQGAAEVGQLGEETAGTIKSGNPFKGVEDAVQKAKQWLGDLGKHFENDAGDHGFMNKAGTKKILFDIKNPSPHENPHAHLEELTNGKWKGVGQIYPRDVPPR